MAGFASLSFIVALRNEKGSYNKAGLPGIDPCIVALRNEKGSYNLMRKLLVVAYIVALRNEKGSYNITTSSRLF